MFEMWDVRNVDCWKYEMFVMWGVWDVGCLGRRMFRIWDVWDWECLGCGMFGRMWDVDIQNAGARERFKTVCQSVSNTVLL